MNDNYLYLNKIWEYKKKIITPTIESLFKFGNWNKKLQFFKNHNNKLISRNIKD